MMCDIIRDLIPLYLDDVCSKETAVFVEKHLENCGECRKVCHDMEVTLYETDKERSEYVDEKKLLNDGKNIIIKNERKRIGFLIRIVDTLMNLTGFIWGIIFACRIGIQGVFDHVVIPLCIESLGMLLVSDLLFFLFFWKRKATSITDALTWTSVWLKVAGLVVLFIMACVIGIKELMPFLISQF